MHKEAMYLRIENKISPKQVAKTIFPDLTDDNLDYDIENQYEWLYLKVPNFEHTLDITRDHGMAEIDDEILDNLTKEEIENVETARKTYIFAIDRKTDEYIDDIPEEVIQYICEKLKLKIAVFSERINMDSEDPIPMKIVSP